MKIPSLPSPGEKDFFLNIKDFYFKIMRNLIYISKEKEEESIKKDKKICKKKLWGTDIFSVTFQG